MLDPFRKAFREHRNNAKKRGIKFLFTYTEWVNWWEYHLGPDWLELRGHKRGQYCMARLGDKGPYRDGNVKCLFISDNLSERKLNGTSMRGGNHPMAVLTVKQVQAIYLDRVTPKSILAAKYHITSGMVWGIRTGQTWRSVTEKLGPPHPKGIRIG